MMALKFRNPFARESQPPSSNTQPQSQPARLPTLAGRAGGAVVKFHDYNKRQPYVFKQSNSQQRRVREL